MSATLVFAAIVGMALGPVGHAPVNLVLTVLQRVGQVAIKPLEPGPRVGFARVRGAVGARGAKTTGPRLGVRMFGSLVRSLGVVWISGNGHGCGAQGWTFSVAEGAGGSECPDYCDLWLTSQYIIMYKIQASKRLYVLPR